MGNITIVHNSKFLHFVSKYMKLELINQITPYSRVLLENLPEPHLVKKFPEFYGTRRFITAFKRGSYLSLS